MATPQTDTPKASAPVQDFDQIQLSPYRNLPDVYMHFMPDNSVQQITDPCYRLLTEHQMITAGGPTLFQEGEVVISQEPPTYHMEPLNRAAGDRIERWLQSMPTNGVLINIDDQVEAANMLRNDPRVKEMSHDDASQAYMKLALGLKAKRDAIAGMSLPPMAGNTFATRRSDAPAMPNTKFTDPSRRGPGHTGEAAVIHQPQRGIDKVQRAGSRPAMSQVGAPSR